MLGETNSFNSKMNSSIIAHNDLLCWLDGTDFINHAPNNKITITNENNYYECVIGTVSGINHPMYHKPGPSINKINISINSRFPYEGFTMCAWGNRKVNTDYMNLFCIGEQASPIVEARIYQNTDAPGGVCCTMYNVDTTVTQLSFSKDIWGFVAIVVDGSQQKIYMNDKLISAPNKINNRTNHTIWHLLGPSTWLSEQSGEIYMTDYRCYNKALTSGEILQIYHNGPQHHNN